MKVVDAMVQNGVWSVLVERGGLPVGVITDGDIMRRCFAKRLDPEACKAQDIMSSPVLTVGPDEPIMEAMKLMAAHDVRRLFVAESGKIVGRGNPDRSVHAHAKHDTRPPSPRTSNLTPT